MNLNQKIDFSSYKDILDTITNNEIIQKLLVVSPNNLIIIH